MAKILAVYGTAYGQTDKIVRRIAATLGERGHSVTICRGDDLRATASLLECDGYVVAASIIRGAHQRYVRDFVRRHAARLNAYPAAFLSVSGAAASPAPEQQAEARRYVDSFLRETGFRPAAVATFGGGIAYRQYGFIMRWMMKQIVRRSGGPTDTSQNHDLTDWGAVDRFAADLAVQVFPSGVAAA
jgi:menaquinone-dependent protoporphyrinogen oxidase